MAGSIFFAHSRAWHSNSNAFLDIMERTIEKCGADEHLLSEILSDAEDARMLVIYRGENSDAQIKLTKRVLEAATDKLRETLADPAGHPLEIDNIKGLMATAEAHLKELQDGRA